MVVKQRYSISFSLLSDFPIKRDVGSVNCDISMVFSRLNIIVAFTQY